MKQVDDETEAAWHRLVTEGIVPTDVRPLIRESWQRVFGRVTPEQKPPVVLDSPPREAEVWKPLLTASIPYLDQLDAWVRETHHLVTLTTAGGLLVHVAGDVSVRRRAESAIHFVPGADYSEAAVGTNAIGTALVTGQAVMVRGAEHVIIPFHEWVCTAAPVWNRATGQLLGAIDITGPRGDDLRHPVIPLIQMLGNMVADIWHEATSDQREWLQTQFSRYVSRYAHDILWLLDSHGGVLASHGPSPSSMDHHAIEEGIAMEAKTIRLPSGTQADLIPLGGEDNRAGWIAILPQGFEIKNPRSWQARYDRHDLIGSHPLYQGLIQQVEQVVPTAVPVLLYGETGVGKERIAHALHQMSSRAHGPFVSVNCGAIPPDLVGPELFGYEGGAFTGARPEGAPGKFEAAQQGTIFLDEIGELPLAVQPYLLRVLEAKELVRVGGGIPISLDVRIVAATHRDLRDLVAANAFRADLYYRLAVIELTVPPLRERISDIPLLARYFLREAGASIDRPNLDLTDDALKVLMSYSWPGNLRELRNVLYRCAIFSGGSAITAELLYRCAPVLAPDPVIAAMERHQGSISAAAAELGVSRSTLYRRLKKTDKILP